MLNEMTKNKELSEREQSILRKYAKLFNELFEIEWESYPAIDLDAEVIKLPKRVSFDRAWVHLDHEISHYLFKSRPVLELISRMRKKASSDVGLKTINVIMELVNFVEDYRVDESWRFTPFKGTYMARVNYIRNAVEKRINSGRIYDLVDIILHEIPEIAQLLQRKPINSSEVNEDVKDIIDKFKELPKKGSIASFPLAIKLFRYLREHGINLKNLSYASTDMRPSDDDKAPCIDAHKTPQLRRVTKKDLDAEKIMKVVEECEKQGIFTNLERELENFEKKYDKELRAIQKRCLNEARKILDKQQESKEKCTKAGIEQFNRDGFQPTIDNSVVNNTYKKFRITIEQAVNKLYGYIGKELDIKEYAKQYSRKEGFLKVFVKQKPKRVIRDVVLFIDLSSSMADVIYGCTRKCDMCATASLAIAKALMDLGGRVIAYTFPAFIVSRKKGRETPQHKIFDTNRVRNKEEIEMCIRHLKIGGGTPLYAALEVFINDIPNLALNRAIAIVITDGVVGLPMDCRKLLRRIQLMGIKAVCLHIGTDGDYSEFKNQLGDVIKCIRVDPVRLVGSLMELATCLALGKL